MNTGFLGKRGTDGVIPKKQLGKGRFHHGIYDYQGRPTCEHGNLMKVCPHRRAYREFTFMYALRSVMGLADCPAPRGESAAAGVQRSWERSLDRPQNRPLGVRLSVPAWQ